MSREYPKTRHTDPLQPLSLPLFPSPPVKPFVLHRRVRFLVLHVAGASERATPSGAPPTYCQAGYISRDVDWIRVRYFSDLGPLQFISDGAAGCRPSPLLSPPVTASCARAAAGPAHISSPEILIPPHISANGSPSLF